MLYSQRSASGKSNLKSFIYDIGGCGLKEGGVDHHDPDPQDQEGEWRLGCLVEHHTQGVHSKMK